MSELPKSLKPWAASLNVLAHDLALTLGPWLQRLSAAVGPLAPSHLIQGGAPDGYDGVTLRGSYERLLSTEWLLADEAPDEFLRRAAAREHQFHQLATTTPKGQRRTLLVFDEGPDQLGSPRIAHLALVMVYAARAEAAGAELVWGTFAGGPQLQYSGFTEEFAQALLDSRTSVDPSAEQLAAWRAEPHDELCVVGGRRLERLVGPVQCAFISINDDWNPGVSRLNITVRRPSRGATAFELNLPAAAIGKQLLRDPFAPKAPKPQPALPRQSGSPINSMVLANTGAHVFMRDEAGQLLALTFPGHVHRKTNRAVNFQPTPHEVVLAAGWSANRILVLSVDTGPDRTFASGDAMLLLRQFTKRGGELSTRRYRVPSAFPRSVLKEPLTTVAVIGQDPTRMIVPFKSGILQLDHTASFTTASVAAWVESYRSLESIIVDEQGRRLRVTERENKTTPPKPLDGLGPISAVFGMRGEAAWSSSPSPAHWNTSRETFEVPPGDEVVAAISFVKLLTLTHRRTWLEVHPPGDKPTVVFVSRNAIQQVAFVANDDRVVVLDSYGNLSFFAPGSNLVTTGSRNGLKWRMERDDQASMLIALANGQTTDAIKAYRERAHVDLATAKSVVETLAAELFKRP